MLASQNGADYEPDTGCLKGLNDLSKAHNAQLSQALTALGGRYPGARITYADLYAPVIAFAAAPARFGFAGADGALRDCCGGAGGKYNFNLSAACGMPGVPACANPSAYVNWDGVHLTEAAYHRVADGWLRGNLGGRSALRSLRAPRTSMVAAWTRSSSYGSSKRRFGAQLHDSIVSKSAGTKRTTARLHFHRLTSIVTQKSLFRLLRVRRRRH
jgi:hypothetical protein